MSDYEHEHDLVWPGQSYPTLYSSSSSSAPDTPDVSPYSMLDYRPTSLPKTSYNIYNPNSNLLDVDSGEWHPLDLSNHHSHFPPAHSHTHTHSIANANHLPASEQSQSRIKQEDITVYSAFGTFNEPAPNRAVSQVRSNVFDISSSSVSPVQSPHAVTLHHLQQQQQQHQAYYVSTSPIGPPPPPTPSPPHYQQHLSAQVHIHQPNPITPQQQHEQQQHQQQQQQQLAQQQHVQQQQYSQQDHNVDPPAFLSSQPPDQLVVPSRHQPHLSHHQQQQYIHPEEISPSESSLSSSSLSAFGTHYSYLGGPGSAGAESDYEGDYGTGAVVVPQPPEVWDPSVMVGTMAISMGQDEDAEGDMDECLVQHDFSYKDTSPEGDLEDDEDQEEEGDDDDDDDSSDPEYAPHARSRSHLRSSTLRHRQQDHRSSGTSPAGGYYAQGRSLRVRSDTATRAERYSPYATYPHPTQSSASSSSPNAALYYANPGYDKSTDVDSFNDYSARPRRTLSDPASYTGSSDGVISPFGLSPGPGTSNGYTGGGGGGSAGRRRSRPSNALPIPIPVPNLTKKSRGRRVPTVETLALMGGSGNNSAGSRSSTSNSQSPASSSGGMAGGRTRRAAAVAASARSAAIAVDAGGTGGAGGKRTYECTADGCGKLFARGEHLKRHVRSIHTYEKPHKCPYIGCEKTFSRHDNLGQHMRVHKDYVPPKLSGSAAYRG